MIQLNSLRVLRNKIIYFVIEELVTNDSTARRQASTLMCFKLVGEKFVNTSPFT